MFLYKEAYFANNNIFLFPDIFHNMVQTKADLVSFQLKPFMIRYLFNSLPRKPLPHRTKAMD